MRIELNIGLNIEGTANTQQQRDSRASFAIAEIGNSDCVILVGTRRAQSATEDTLVTICEGAAQSVTDVATDLAYSLDQEAIALFNVETGVGELVGPYADRWGAFNPKFFIRFAI